MKPVVELVTSGAELLNGRVLNRHAQWLGSQLDLIHWSLLRDTTVADDPHHIHDAMMSALDRVDVVIVTGGLGPTSDDVTRDVAAAWFQTSLVMHEPSRQAVISAYQARNKPLNSTVERHALVVDGAAVLDNRHGLAPGEHLTKNGKHLFLLPGPPHEFQGVMRDHVLPWMKQQQTVAAGRLQIVQTAGLGESDIAAKLEGSGFDTLNIDVAYCAEPGRVSIRIRERVNHTDDFDQSVAIIWKSLGDSIYADVEERIEQTVGRLLKGKGRTIAVAESCTGGLIGQRLTSISGSSAFMLGGVIAYHNDVKQNVLGVDSAVLTKQGAVSAQVAAAMAEGVRRLMKADAGIAVTGIAGPDGGSPEKPVGLVYIAVADERGTEVRELRLGGGREIIREASATMALNLVRLRLTSNG